MIRLTVSLARRLHGREISGLESSGTRLLCDRRALGARWSMGDLRKGPVRGCVTDRLRGSPVQRRRGTDAPPVPLDKERPERDDRDMVNRRAPGLGPVPTPRWKCDHVDEQGAACQYWVEEPNQPKPHALHPRATMLRLPDRPTGSPRQ